MGCLYVLISFVGLLGELLTLVIGSSGRKA
jgi:hypothetical protein